MNSLYTEPSTYQRSVIGGGFILALMLFCSTAIAFAPPPETADLLLVANGNYSNEALLEGHFDDLGYNVVKLKDYQVTSSTNFGSYDLVVITGFAPNITTSAMDAMLASGVPVLAVSYWNQSYAQKLGLVTTSSAEYYGSDGVVLSGRGPDSVARYLGEQPLVYTTSYTMYGALDSQVVSGAEIVAQCASDLDLAVALYNSTTKRAALGAYDAQRYTADGWRLLDLLLNRLSPPGPIWVSITDQAQGYIDSGLAVYVAQVAADPNSFTVSEVRTEVWNTLVAWNLLPLFDQAVAPLPAPILDGWAMIDPDFVLPTQLPNIHHPRCGHPNDKWFAGQAWMDIPDSPNDTDTEPEGCTAQYYPDCPECEVYDERRLFPIEYVVNLDQNGPYWPDEAFSQVSTEEYGVLSAVPITVTKSYYLRGTDMGASVMLGDKTYFYMGDTWGFDAACVDNNGNGCPNGYTLKNDAILTSTDDNYSDGVDAFLLLGTRNDNRKGFVGVGLDGVHWGLEPYVDQLWNPANSTVPIEPPFTTTGSAFTMTRDWMISMPPPFASIPMSLQTVVVNYNTASQGVADGQKVTPTFASPLHGGGWDDCELNPFDCNIPLSRKNPRSFMGCSLDGVHFSNCYEHQEGLLPSSPPFSKDDFTFTTCGSENRVIDWSDKSRFAGFVAVQLSAEDLDLVCNPQSGTDLDSALCNFDGTGGGILLYGKPRPAGSGPLTLAFIPNEDFGKVWEDGAFAGKPLAFYYAGDGNGMFGGAWSLDEQDAAPLPQYAWTNGFPCDEDKMEADQNGVIPYYDPAMDETFEATQYAIVHANDTAIIAGIGLTMADYTEQVMGITKAAASGWSDWHDGSFRSAIDVALVELNFIKQPTNTGSTASEKAFAAYWYNSFLGFKTFARYRDCSANSIPPFFTAPRYTPETCLLTEAQRAKSSSVASVRIVREPDPTHPVILLFGGNKYRWASLATPWNVSNPIVVNTQTDWNDNPLTNDVEGYGTFILPGEQGLSFEQTGNNGPSGGPSGVLHVYHTVSTWDGANVAPYGVYTRQTLLSWPPPQPSAIQPFDPYIRPYLYVTSAADAPWPTYDEVEFDKIMRSVVVTAP